MRVFVSLMPGSWRISQRCIGEGVLLIGLHAAMDRIHQTASSGRDQIHLLQRCSDLCLFARKGGHQYESNRRSGLHGNQRLRFFDALDFAEGFHQQTRRDLSRPH